MDVLREQLRRFGVEVEELAGTRVGGEVPLSAPLLNRLIAARLAGGRGPVAAVRVDPLDGNAFDVFVTPSARLLPSITVRATIERQPELPSRPVLVLRWSIPAAGFLARLASPFIGGLKSLPPGVRIQDDQVFVDIRQMLDDRGMADLLGYVTALRVDTRAGVVVVTFELRAPGS